mgnify:FL=1
MNINLIKNTVYITAFMLWGAAAGVTYIKHTGPMSPAAAYQHLEGSVVEYTNIPGETMCTATMINVNTYLTAAHCGAGNGRRYIVTAGGDAVLAVSLEADEDGADWAIIRTDEDPAGVVPMPVAVDFEPAIGEPVAYLGYPYPTEQFYSEGIIVSLNALRIPSDLFAITSLHGGPGASGSAIISLRTGEIIGVLSMGLVNIRGNLMGVGFTPITLDDVS